MEELFLHLWDEFDDIVGVCRHVVSCAAAEAVADAAPLIGALCGALLAGAAALLLARPHFTSFLS